MSADIELDEAALEKAAQAVEAHFMLDKCGTAKQTAEIAIRAYRAAESSLPAQIEGSGGRDE